MSNGVSNSIFLPYDYPDLDQFCYYLREQGYDVFVTRPPSLFFDGVDLSVPCMFSSSDHQSKFFDAHSRFRSLYFGFLFATL